MDLPRNAPTMEDELDYLLSQVSDSDLHELLDDDSAQLHHQALSAGAPVAAASIQPHPLQLSSNNGEGRFATFKTDADVEAAQASATPLNTTKSTNWAVKIWREWTTHRRKHCYAVNCPPHILLCTRHQLNQWLSKFVLEVRRQDGEPYPPQTLYQICCGLQRYVRELHPDFNFMKDPQLAGFQRTLDGEMKRLRSVGLGAKRRQAEPIQVSEENVLWEKGLLGCTTPQVLVDTMVFLCGLYFALRSGQEHRSLTLDQLELFEPDDGPAYLLYTENASKNNTGGLAQCKVQPKHVVHHSIVQLFKNTANIDHQAKKNSAFYLTPLKKPKGDIWLEPPPLAITHCQKQCM